MSSSPTKTILVIGATGQQGRAVISVLLANAKPSEPNLTIIAVTRNPSSTAAQTLASNSNVHVIAGDLSNPDAIFENATKAVAAPVWGLYHVQVNSNTEETQGKAIVDAAVRNGVRHYVYASADRGGPLKSDYNPTDVKNLRAKYAVEQHLKLAAVQSGAALAYTILRPVTFFDNVGADLHGRGFVRMWEQMGAKPLKFVATADIGWFAAQSFLFPGSETYRNKALTLVGDDLTQREADEVFEKIMVPENKAEKGMPMAPCLIGSAVKWVKGDTVGDLFAWFVKEGYGGSIESCKAIHPEMMGLTANQARWKRAL